MGTLQFAVFALLAFSIEAKTVAHHDQQVVCYLGSWSVYRPFPGKFMINDINPKFCTHLVYSFAGLDETTNTIKSLDPEYDFTKRAYADFVELKRQNFKLKVLLAIGGWTEGSSKYSNMASTAGSRKIFIDSVIKFIKEHGFDGLDLDWEYPANRGGKPADKKNFVSLVRELKREFDTYDWILTAAVGAGKSTIESAYDIPNLSKYLDFIHIMAYDYHGKWDLFTGHNAPLYPRDDEALDQKFLNVEYSVNHYLRAGAPANKLILGVGFYGRTFLLTNSSNYVMGAPTNPAALAFAGAYTREDGFLGYNEICELQKNETGLWNTVWNRGHQAPYMFRDNMWVSYDNDHSLHAKVRFAQENGLAGMMVWSIDTDDFMGRCGAGKFPLLSAINKALQETVDARPTGLDDKDIYNVFDGDSDNRLGKSSVYTGSTAGSASTTMSIFAICLTALFASMLT